MSMISRLRWKFVAINMMIVAALLACVCLTIGGLTQESLRQDSLSLLNRVIERDSFGSFFQRKDREVVLPYFTVRLDMDGRAVILDSQFYDLSNEELLTQIVSECMRREENSGVLEEYGLRYLRKSQMFGWKMAFSDISQEKSTLHQMIETLVTVSIIALCALFFVSLLLARWAVRPVERAWQQQRQFVADASHELKTPLTVVLSNVDMLQHYSDGRSPREERWLENIRGSSRQMQALVEAMLVLARSDAVVSQTQLSQRLNLSDLVMDSVLLFEPTVFEAGKTLTDAVEEDIFVMGDGAKLQRLVEILLDNARKYGSEGGEIRVTLTHEGSKRAVLTVYNDGEPIPAAQRAHLFERFYRSDSARTTEGFGLGLSIAERTVKEHHGSISVHSEEHGNSFRVVLPAAK